MFGIGPLELVVILVVALLVFGPKRVPELARTVGRGLAEFRRASADLRQTLALDELQRDLQRDLDNTQTIHRPEDRPAQAGDDTTPDAKGAAKSADDSATESPESAPTTPTDSGTPAAKLEDESTTHRDPVDSTDISSDPETNPNSPADSPLGNIPASDSGPKRG
jgi:sec-independent protein translocase protein TatB